MVENFSTDPISLILTIIISGGIIAGFFEWIRNWHTRKREEYLEITKLKIDKISNALPFYHHFIYYFNSIHNYIEYASKEPDSVEVHKDNSKIYLYHISNLLYYYDEFSKKFGVLQLDCLDAEIILSAILNQFIRTIKGKIGDRSLSIIRSEFISENNRHLSFHEFEDKIIYYDYIKKDFETNLLSDEERLKKIDN